MCLKKKRAGCERRGTSDITAAFWGTWVKLTHKTQHLQTWSPRHKTQNGKPWDKERAQISKTSCWSDQQKVLTPISQPKSGYFREVVTATMGATLSLGRQKAQISTLNSPAFLVNSQPVYIATLCLLSAPIKGKRANPDSKLTIPEVVIGESISNLYCKWGLYINVTFQNITHSRH